MINLNKLLSNYIYNLITSRSYRNSAVSGGGGDAEREYT